MSSALQRETPQTKMDCTVERRIKSSKSLSGVSKSQMFSQEMQSIDQKKKIFSPIIVPQKHESKSNQEPKRNIPQAKKHYFFHFC